MNWRSGILSLFISMLMLTCSISFGSPPRPVARFIASPSNGSAPLTVSFVNQSSGNIQSALLSFGDGEVLQLRSWSVTNHVYPEAGSFNATLKVSNKSGSSTWEQLIVVTNRPVFTSVTLAWNPSVAPNISFYTAYMGFSSSNYSSTNITTTTSTTFNGLAHGTTYFFNVDCTSSSGLESQFNHEISYTP